VRTGRKLAVKLWNVGRFLSLNAGEEIPSGAGPAAADRSMVDRWVLSHLASAVAEASEAFEVHDYAAAYQAASRMFWSVYCDRYLEMIKDQVGTDAGTQWTLRESFRVLLGLFAPFAPFVTEDLYQRFYRQSEPEPAVSLHVTRWPVADPSWAGDTTAVDQLAVILDATRVLRSGLKLGSSTRLKTLTLQAEDPAAEQLLAVIAEPLRVAARADAVLFGIAEQPSGVDGISVAIAV
jgi:valyl-tRNA synthetase